jgi:Domain of unknown function (DUF4160)
MPEITRFYGIVIKLFFGDHSPPHFHAVYGEFNGIFTINPLEMIEGDLPDRAKNLIIEWAEIYKKDLLDMWESQKFYKLPSLK